MTLTILPRQVIGTPDPPVDRQKVVRPCSVLIVHYTGAFGPRYSLPATELADAKAVADYGKAAGKTWEYNNLVGLAGGVYEQAGEYKGAHCLNYNPDSYGVLMMVAVGVAPTSAMVDSFNNLRRHLVDIGQLTLNHAVRPHYMYRSTACPGNTLAGPQGMTWDSPTGQGRIGIVLPVLSVPLVLRPPIDVMPTPPTIPTTEDNMIALDWQPGGPNWTVFGYNLTHLAWMKSGANQVANAVPAPRVTINSTQLLDIINSSSQTTGPPTTLTPAMLAAWG